MPFDADADAARAYGRLGAWPPPASGHKAQIRGYYAMTALLASTPLRCKNTAVANHPRRLLPSMSGSCLTSDCKRAAAWS